MEDFNGSPAFACWYPQMGGYVGKAVVVMQTPPPIKVGSPEDESSDYCFDAYVWHDGEFPFSETDDRNPVRIHHCMPSQFIDFGEFVLSKQEEL